MGREEGERKAAQSRLATKAGSEPRELRDVAGLWVKRRGVTWVKWAHGVVPWPGVRKWG